MGPMGLDRRALDVWRAMEPDGGRCGLTRGEVEGGGGGAGWCRRFATRLLARPWLRGADTAMHGCDVDWPLIITKRTSIERGKEGIACQLGEARSTHSQRG